MLQTKSKGANEPSDNECLQIQNSEKIDLYARNLKDSYSGTFQLFIIEQKDAGNSLFNSQNAFLMILILTLVISCLIIIFRCIIQKKTA